MDLFLFFLLLGFLGLIAIALLGHSLGHHGAHGHTHGHLHGHGHIHARGHAHDTHTKAGVASAFSDWISPRVIFSLLFAFGAVGTILHNLLPFIVVVAIALFAAWAFERWLVQPIWQLLFGFASNPARTLESALLEEAEAVTNFDQRGQGLVAVQLDGQLVQILASLSPNEQRTGARIHAGERLSIIAVNAKRNSCTVTRLPVAAVPSGASATQ